YRDLHERDVALHIDVEFDPGERRIRPNPDAKLIELEPRFLAAVAAYDRSFDEHHGADPEVDDACDAVFDLGAQICDLPASTLSGLRIKARVLAWIQPSSMMSGPDNPQLYDQLVTSLIGDLIPEAV